MLKTSDFDYDLPKELIAQSPSALRDQSRLMVYDSGADKVLHKKFFNLKDFLVEGDILVVNSSKVIPARLKFDVDGLKREIFLLKSLGDLRYTAMVRPGKAFRVGASFVINQKLNCEVLEVLEDGTRVFEFNADPLNFGEMPLPPYISNSDVNVLDRYQTVYAKSRGSVAAPTAGLHFSDDLMEELKQMGVSFVEVVLHVGRGTFLPVSSEDLSGHKMHSEEFELSDQAAEALNVAHREGRRIIAVGTTSVRVLESTFVDGCFVPQRANTEIFIYPGYHWKVVDALITNFHLPKSTLLMLIAAFLESKGVEAPVSKLKDLYSEAIENAYRFYSFGDASLIF